MNRPKPYYVSYEASTPDERGPGWFWGHEADEGKERIRGPYFTRGEAEDAIESFMFDTRDPSVSGQWIWD